jgi:hypothetical protein
MSLRRILRLKVLRRIIGLDYASRRIRRIFLLGLTVRKGKERKGYVFDQNIQNIFFWFTNFYFCYLKKNKTNSDRSF